LLLQRLDCIFLANEKGACHRGEEAMKKCDPSTTRIGFVGTGVMGKSMASNLMKAGYSLSVFTRTKAKARDLIDRGARWFDTAGDLSAESDVIITMVGYPADVEEIYLGAQGVVAQAKPETICIDTTTSSPSLAQRICAAAYDRGIFVLDAPVSGGDIGARDGTLSIMVGGNRDAFDAAMPVFSAMGKNIVLQGAAGSGQHAKMANQIAVGAGMVAVCESLAYAQRAGLDPEAVLKSIAGGAAGSWAFTNMAPRILGGEFGPGFYIRHFVKDLRIARDASRRMQFKAPGLEMVMKLYEKMAAEKMSELGIHALFKLYEKRKKNRGSR
jgi:3-hydroxyisobutyrate dehydrogenase